MIVIQTKNSADRFHDVAAKQSKRLDGSPGPVPAPRLGYTNREAEVPAPPATGGTLKWDSVEAALIWEPTPPGPVPTLTARQLRLWLLSVHITPEQIDAQIAAMADGAAQARARVEWEYATAYHHDHPLVLQIGAALGLDQTQIDAAFRAAALL